MDDDVEFWQRITEAIDQRVMRAELDLAHKWDHGLHGTEPRSNTDHAQPRRPEHLSATRFAA